MRGDAGADRPHVAVEGATRHDHIRRQAQSLRPFRCQMTDGFVCRLRLQEQTSTETSQHRIKRSQKFLAGKSAPLRVPHRLMPTGTTAADDIGSTVHTGQEGRHPLAMFDNGIGGAAHGLVLAEHM